MNLSLADKDHACRLIFEGRMTCEFARELEDQIIDALRRYRHFEVDLSGVSEIDLCGVRLLGVLEAVGGKAVKIVATSPAVERGKSRALAAGRGRWLRGDAAGPRPLGAPGARQ